VGRIMSGGKRAVSCILAQVVSSLPFKVSAVLFAPLTSVTPRFCLFKTVSLSHFQGISCLSTQLSPSPCQGVSCLFTKVSLVSAPPSFCSFPARGVPWLTAKVSPVSLPTSVPPGCFFSLYQGVSYLSTLLSPVSLPRCFLSLWIASCLPAKVYLVSLPMVPCIHCVF
jgi:hypothetical protein